MTHPPSARLQSYVHGQMDVTTRLLIEAHLALCPSCSAVASEFRRTDGRLPGATLHDELDLPPFERVWMAARRASLSRVCRCEHSTMPHLLATLPSPVRWRSIAVWPGRVKVALLMRDADTGSELYLCHLASGSTFPRHRHEGLEENVILAGGYRNGDCKVEAGDWVVGAPGTVEMSRAEDEECWCLSRVEPPGVRFTGWRRWIR